VIWPSRAQLEALFEGLGWRRVVAEKEAFITELKALIEKLEGQAQDYRRTKFGPKSEKLDPAQLELALQGEPLIAHRCWPRSPSPSIPSICR